MSPEEAQAYSQGEFRGIVITKLESIQSELSEHKKDHKKDQKRNGASSSGLTVYIGAKTLATLLASLVALGGSAWWIGPLG